MAQKRAHIYSDLSQRLTDEQPVEATCADLAALGLNVNAIAAAFAALLGYHVPQTNVRYWLGYRTPSRRKEKTE